jgi:calcineurin-like phosphoesterase family protein
MRYWTSDLHLQHKNIIEYCKRPFTDKDQMTQAIHNHLFEKLKKGDELVVVGDVAMNPKFALDLGRLLTMQGVKLICVMGNHDSCHPCAGPAVKTLSQAAKWENAGWELHLHYETKLADGTPVLVSHMPYANDETLEYDKRYLQYRPQDDGKILIHGHLHGKYKKLGRMIDVGFDPHEGKILTEDELIALVHDPRHRIDCHLTQYFVDRKANGEEKTDMKGL